MLKVGVLQAMPGYLTEESIRLEWQRSPILSSLEVTFLLIEQSFLSKPVMQIYSTLCNYEKTQLGHHYALNIIFYMLCQ